jgi:hypothetical protein
LTGTWVDITTFGIYKQEYAHLQPKDFLFGRRNMESGFKGVELRNLDQFKVGTKIFEIQLINI